MKGAQLDRGCLRSFDLEPHPNFTEANSDIAGDTKSASEIKIAVDDHFDAFNRDASASRDHLARDLGAGGKGSEQ